MSIVYKNLIALLLSKGVLRLEGQFLVMRIPQEQATKAWDGIPTKGHF